MNCFSTFSGMRSMINKNSISYINKYAKSITLDFSGTNFTDLSATPFYAISAAGLNSRSTDISNSFAILKYNNRPLVVSDFGSSSSSSFTFYLKHAASSSVLPPFNFLYPTTVKLSAPYTTINQDFSAQFYSFLSPGTIVPYSITGCASSDLSNAALNGTFAAPFQEITYRVTAVPSTNLVSFNVSGGLSTSLPLVTSIEYGVTVLNNSKYAINGVQLEQITFLPSKIYVFRQTDGNFGTYPIKFSRIPDGTAISASDSQWTLSVEGTTTTLFLNSSFTGVLYYYSTALPYMGYSPPSITVSAVSSEENQIGQNSTFQFTILNNTSAAISFSMSSSVTTGIYALTAGQLYDSASTSSGYSLVNQTVPTGTTVVYCKNTALIYQTITCTLNSGASQTAVLAGPPPTITFNPTTPVTYGSSFTISIRNTYSSSITAVVSTGGSVATTRSDLTIANETLAVPLYAGADYSLSCTNQVETNKKVTCTITAGSTITSDLSLNAYVNYLSDFNVVGVGSNCFTITWKTPTIAVNQYSLVYNGGTSLTILSSSITNNTQYGYSGYTLKSITRSNTFSVSLSFTDVNGNSGNGIKTVSNISASAFTNPPVNASIYNTPSILNSFTLIRFIASTSSFSMPTAASNPIKKVGVILVGTGGSGGSDAGGSTGMAGGGSGGGVAFYPFYSTYAVTPPTPTANVTIGATTFGQLTAVSVGNDGQGGQTNGVGANGGSSVSTSTNGVVLTSGRGGIGNDHGNRGVSITEFIASNGVTLFIPELDVSYNFSGGGGGGIYFGNFSHATYRNACLTIRNTFGTGAGGTDTVGAQSGVSYTGSGGGGRAESSGGSFAGGSGVAYMYYSTYDFTVS